MYEKPELTHIGDAEEMILGPAFDGGDIDMNWSPNQFEAETLPYEK
jgi:hypothetical protein